MPADEGQDDITWTTTRVHVRALLQDVHADAAELYSHAVDALCGTPVTRPRLMIASHCIRELVPTVVGAQNLVSPKRADTSKPASELAVAWERFDLRLSPDDGEQDMTDDEIRPIQHAVYIAARQVAAAGAKGTQNSRTMTALFATGQDTDTNTAPLRRLHAALGAFRGWPHHPDYTKPLKELPPVAELEWLLHVVEEALLTRFENRGDRVAALREQLKRANRRGGKFSHA